METINNAVLNMIVIEKIDKPAFPFDWADLDYYPNSRAVKKEIYVANDEQAVEELMYLFYALFGSRKEQLFIFHKSWWDFCLDTWDIDKDEYNYDLDNKSAQSGAYLALLKESDLEPDYSGCCRCNDWDRFLPVILQCLVTQLYT
jgi:hypothetical protein